MARQRCLKLLLAGIFCLGGVSVLAILLSLLMSRDPLVLARYRLSVKQSELRSPHVLYSWSSSDWNGEDDTLISTLSLCRMGACVPQDMPVFAGCAVRSPRCIPPWTTAPAMPTGLLVPPLNGYPPKYASSIVAMLANPATRCTSVMGSAPWSGMYNDWSTLCVSPMGMVLYRSVHL